MRSVIRPDEQESTRELRRGPWTCEEDSVLMHYVTRNGEGHWNSLANHAGLKRTGKSCRLRWLNYLKPDIKRGNLTQQEQLLIFELHSKWGNRWSKIAQHLPGRTDNEIKNYWRTRVQKQVHQLNTKSNRRGFVDAVQCIFTSSDLNTSSSTNSTTLDYTPCNHSDSSVHQDNLGPPKSSPSNHDSPNKAMPISIHPKGCLNSFIDQSILTQDSMLSFMPDMEEFPKPSNIYNFYDFDRSRDHHVNTGNNIPIDCFGSCSVDYVDTRSVDQLTEFQANFDMSDFDYQLACGDSFWNRMEI